MSPVILHVPALRAADASEQLPGILLPLLAIAGAIVVGLALAAVVTRVVRVSARRWRILDTLSDRTIWPVRLLLVAIGVWLAVSFTTDSFAYESAVNRALGIVVIVASAWLLLDIAIAIQDGILARFPTDVIDNRHARRVHTQVRIMGRLTAALIIVVAAAVILFSFPAMRAFGASVLASAGLAAIIAGLAAQSTLSNLFAGLQVTFSDSIRVDDVVVVEGEWGRIEEITLTYVVVKIWDERRLVLPSTYFTATPFENWTREAAELIGAVELDVDWTIPLEGLRRELDRLLAETDLWDGRKSSIQVTDATGGMVRVRVLASAANASILWDLRCYLREALVTWVQQAESGLPRSRFERITPQARET